jgi:2,4'-dihydroxyacetophenone dioxygenase
MDLSEKIKIAGVEPLNLPTPDGALPLIAVDFEHDDEKYWMKLTDTVYSRPLVINTHNGGWIEMFKISEKGLINRHRHSTPALVYCLEGSFGYLEHDWVLGPNSFLYEPVGESHTFVCYSEGGMKALAVMYGPLTIVDETGKDLFTIDSLGVLDLYKKHCAEVGLGEEFAESLVR